ncbi:hypothetical protein PFISCL1PPCAC_24987, partial [Pristionchus fissidentatus]
IDLSIFNSIVVSRKVCSTFLGGLTYPFHASKDGISILILKSSHHFPECSNSIWQDVMVSMTRIHSKLSEKSTRTCHLADISLIYLQFVGLSR